MTDEHARSWYVKASFGAEWGPMSLDTMRQMAADGALANGDLARCGVDAEWQPVLELLNQAPTQVVTTSHEEFAASDQESASDGMPDEPDDAESLTTTISETSLVLETAAISERSTEVETAQPVKRRPGALPNWSSFWQGESPTIEQPMAVPQLIIEDDHQLHHAEVTDIEPPPDDAGERLADPINDRTTENDKPEVSEELRALDSWKRERQKRLDRLMKIVVDREAAAAEAARIAAEPQSAPVETTDEAAETEAETPSPSAEQKRTPTRNPVQRRTMTPGSWDETLDRWKRSLPHPITVLVVLLVPVMVWWFWPSSDAATAKTYNEMYSELRRQRDLPNNKSGMDEFVQRSQTKLDELLPRLKRRASSKDPDSQLLLWIGRDCLRPLLKSPRTRDTKHEHSLKKLLAQWNEAHHITPEESSDEPSPKSVAEEPLRSPSSNVKGLGFGTAPEREANAEEELPTTAPPEKPQKDRGDTANPN